MPVIMTQESIIEQSLIVSYIRAIAIAICSTQSQNAIIHYILYSCLLYLSLAVQHHCIYVSLSLSSTFAACPTFKTMSLCNCMFNYHALSLSFTVTQCLIAISVTVTQCLTVTVTVTAIINCHC